MHFPKRPNKFSQPNHKKIHTKKPSPKKTPMTKTFTSTQNSFTFISSHTINVKNTVLTTFSNRKRFRECSEDARISAQSDVDWSVQKVWPRIWTRCSEFKFRVTLNCTCILRRRNVLVNENSAYLIANCYLFTLFLLW